VDSVLRSPLRETVAQSVASFKPDVVHFQSGAAAAIAPIRGAPSVAVPLDADDLNALARVEAARSPISRWLAQREATRFSHFEAEAYAKCDRIVVVTERDAAALRKLNAALRPTVIPNGIDTIRFSPGSTESSTSTIVFHGAMDYEPNVDAAQFLVQEIIPIVKDRHPNARVILAGRHPSRAVRDLSNGDVQVTGELESIVPVIRDAAVYVCPMRVGSGIKNKLLEAMACGRAIVATRLATSGIPIEAGVHALVEEQPQNIASAISDVLGDSQLRLRLGRAARKLAEQRSWARCAEEFETLYAELSAGPRI
jgi:glycosyltransferase involved in cell wall biosynthesis